MPTVLRLDGMRVVVYPNDHRPPHVHVISGSEEAIFLLNCPEGPVILRENFGFAFHELNAIAGRLGLYVVRLCQSWEGIHGGA